VAIVPFFFDQIRNAATIRARAASKPIDGGKLATYSICTPFGAVTLFLR
jgi:hypothetical protein